MYIGGASPGAIPATSWAQRYAPVMPVVTPSGAIVVVDQSTNQPIYTIEDNQVQELAPQTPTYTVTTDSSGQTVVQPSAPVYVSPQAPAAPPAAAAPIALPAPAQPPVIPTATTPLATTAPTNFLTQSIAIAGMTFQTWELLAAAALGAVLLLKKKKAPGQR